jgi:hypothetical protein
VLPLTTNGLSMPVRRLRRCMEPLAFVPNARRAMMCRSPHAAGAGLRAQLADFGNPKSSAAPALCGYARHVLEAMSVTHAVGVPYIGRKAAYPLRLMSPRREFKAFPHAASINRLRALGSICLRLKVICFSDAICVFPSCGRDAQSCGRENG